MEAALGAGFGEQFNPEWCCPGKHQTQDEAALNGMAAEGPGSRTC